MSPSAAVPLLEDDTLAFGDEDLDTGIAKGVLTHPYVTLFHLSFRGCALFGYLFCRFFTDSFISSFITIVLLLSMDFWTVKNITGRLMVGLRWWNYIDDDGKSHWVFESRKGIQQNRINDREAFIFWTALVLTPIIWGILFLIAFFSFSVKWLLIVMIALVLSGSNLYGYLKCKMGSNESITNVTTNFFRNQVLKNAVSIVSSQTKTPFTDEPANAI